MLQNLGFASFYSFAHEFNSKHYNFYKKIQLISIINFLVIDDVFNYISLSYVGQVANNNNHKQQPFMDGKKIL